MTKNYIIPLHWYLQPLTHQLDTQQHLSILFTQDLFQPSESLYNSTQHPVLSVMFAIVCVCALSPPCPTQTKKQKSWHLLKKRRGQRRNIGSDTEGFSQRKGCLALLGKSLVKQCCSSPRDRDGCIMSSLTPITSPELFLPGSTGTECDRHRFAN